MFLRGTGLSKIIPRWLMQAYCRLDFAYNFLFSSATKEGDCPICGSIHAKIFLYGKDPSASGPALNFEEVSKGHSKYCCISCKHIYALWLRKDTKTVGEMYSQIYAGDSEVSLENERKELQKRMIWIAHDFHKKNPGKTKEGFKVLDFSCGPNFRAAFELREEGLDAYCCDILPFLPYDGDIFFKQEPKVFEKYKENFDAICSVDVLEHLNFPIQDFQNFNTMLKPGGLMVHFTPMINYMTVFRSHLDTAFHTNFFSNKSINLLCEKTGFELLQSSHPSQGFWYYVFKKKYCL